MHAQAIEENQQDSEGASKVSAEADTRSPAKVTDEHSTHSITEKHARRDTGDNAEVMETVQSSKRPFHPLDPAERA